MTEAQQTAIDRIRRILAITEPYRANVVSEIVGEAHMYVQASNTPVEAGDMHVTFSVGASSLTFIKPDGRIVQFGPFDRWLLRSGNLSFVEHEQSGTPEDPLVLLEEAAYHWEEYRRRIGLLGLSLHFSMPPTFIPATLEEQKNPETDHVPF